MNTKRIRQTTPILPFPIGKNTPIHHSVTLQIEPQELPNAEHYIFSLDGERKNNFLVLGFCDSRNIQHVYNTDNAVFVNDILEPVGLLVEIVSKPKQITTLPFSITLKPIARVLLRIEEIITYKIVRKEETASLFAIRPSPLKEIFLPEEEDALESLTEFSNLITEQQGLNILNTVQYKEFVQSNNFFTRMNILAEAYLTESERDTYIQDLSNVTRFRPLIDKVTSRIRSKTVQARRTRTKAEPKSLTLDQRIQQLDMPDNVRPHVLKELKRLENLPVGSNEFSNVIDYLECISDIPWNVSTNKTPVLKEVIPELNKTHYGLSDIKDHILEYMTIDHIKGSPNGGVLCFVGPPGTGKTSIAKSIARATNRQVAHIALGGISDEAEIRGHRRTYLGSRPGRIVQAIRGIKTLDPLFILDEIDKLSRWRGDPAAALLELLDPEQNSLFQDSYLEVPLDLSKAMFVCTANYREQIPPALFDRMEIIEFREYTKQERYEILRQYIVPKSLEEYNLTDYPIKIPDETLEQLSDIVQIRQSEKLFKKLLRRAAVQLIVKDEIYVKLDMDSTNNKTKQKIGF